MFKNKLNLILIILITSCSAHIQPPAKYILNFIWINPSNQSDQLTVLPNTQSFEHLMKWARLHPKSLINLWFDSKFSNPAAIAKTHELINLNINKNKIAPIRLQDIRQLEVVQKNPAVFKSEIPIYFRVDLLRAIIFAHLLKKDHESCLVYSDLDIKPISQKKLFDRKTLALLKQNKFVMAKANSIAGFENAFQIFTYDQKLIAAIDRTLIDFNIKRAQKFIAEFSEVKNKQSFFSTKAVCWKAQRANFQEIVFHSYPLMLACYDQLKQGRDFKLPVIDDYFDYNCDWLKPLDKLKMPVKKIKMPTSSSKSFETK